MRKKSFKSTTFLFLCSGLLIIVFLEIILRLLGYQPFQPRPKAALVGLKAWEVDSKLGWKLIPGHYEIGPFNDKGDSMSITVKKDTGRITRITNEGVSQGQITFIGGSFMMGYGLDDNQTATWKLQKHFPTMDFRNLAVSGYGTFQSLLVLEEELKKGNRPKCVVYGAFQHHQLRNVAQGDWLMELKREIPYVTLDNDSTFKRNELSGMYNLPLTRHLALAFMTEKALNRMLSYKRVKDAEEVTHLILKEMQRLCLQHNILFYVAVLHYPPDEIKRLCAFLDEHHIDFIDCHIALTKDNIIKDNGHPNERVNDIWAERIAKRLILDRIVD